MRMIATCLDSLNADDAFALSLEKLAKSHAARGVVVNEYFLVGEVLIWTLDRSLGVQFDNATKTAWLKIYSIMLTHIVPAAVREEAAIAAADQ